MPFQSAVRFDQAYGIPGEYAFDGPYRAEPGILRSATPANNVFGRLFTEDPATPGIWRAGNVGPIANVRKAIMTSPKQHASYGTAAGGPLAPTLVMPNEVSVELTTMGQIIVQAATANNLIGNIVRYIIATGEIVSAVPGTALPGTQEEIPNAVVIRVPQPTINNLMVVQLTTQ